MKVFLGGTCNDSRWREQLKPLLQIDYFDPVVDDWTGEARMRELEERATCDRVLYCLTPRMAGVYSVAELVDDSNKRPAKTLFVWLLEDDGREFSPGQIKSLQAVARLVERNGATVVEDLTHAARVLNWEAVGERP